MNLRRITIFAVCLAAGACGFWLAHPMAKVPHEAPSAGSISGFSASSSGNGGNTRNDRSGKKLAVKERSAEQLAALKKEIMRGFSNSPSPEHDWILRTQTAALLATLSVDQLREFVAELVPSENEGISTGDWEHPLIKQIYQAWGLKDPVSASLSQSGGFGFGMSAFNDWLMRDPEAATLFFQQTHQAGKLDGLAKSMQRSLLNRQALSNLQGASQSLAGLDPEVRQSMLTTWTRMFANDPAKRQELVALLTSMNDPKISETCLKSLIGEFSKRSPSEAAALVETLAVSEELKNQLSHEVIGEWAKKEPKQAFNAWLQLGEAEVPKPFYAALDEWSTNFPGVDESIEWVGGLESGPVREQLKNHMIGYLAELERFPQAGKLSTDIDNPTERLRQMKLVKRIWEERYPENANDWFSKLPPEDQAAMEKPLE